jgi:ATP-dependent DNA ligase
MLGKVLVKQENGVAGEVGSGFNDADREYIWNNKDKFLGRKIECKFQELTDDGKMRFPIFLRFRDDK